MKGKWGEGWVINDILILEGRWIEVNRRGVRIEDLKLLASYFQGDNGILVNDLYTQSEKAREIILKSRRV